MLFRSKIIAVDIVDKKLILAQKLGATHIVNSRKNDPEMEIDKITAGKLVDYAVEAAGTVVTMETAFRVTNYGGQCIIAGNIPEGERIAIDPMDLIKGKQIKGTWGGETTPDEDIPTYSDLYQSGKMKLSQLITHEYRLADINKAFDDLGSGQVGRAIVALGEDN